MRFKGSLRPFLFFSSSFGDNLIVQDNTLTSAKALVFPVTVVGGGGGGASPPSRVGDK